jgi:hypothetical protein
VQLFFKRGTPYLRFCKQKNKPGHVLEMRSVEQAQKAAAKACKCW